MGAAAGNGHQVDYPRAAGSEVAGIRAEAIGIRSEQRQSGEGVDALRSARTHRASYGWRCERNLVARKSLADAYKVLVPRLSVARSSAVDNVPNRSDARGRCVPLPRVASGRLGLSVVGCDLNQPSRWLRVLLAVAQQGEQLEACST